MKIMKIFQDCKKVIVYVQFSITFYQKQINECAFGEDNTNNTTNLIAYSYSVKFKVAYISAISSNQIRSISSMRIASSDARKL